MTSLISQMCELNIPASLQQIEQAEIQLKCSIPPVLSHLYQRHDGFQTYLVGDQGGTSLMMNQGGTSLMMNFFSTSNDNIRTHWLTDETDKGDWEVLCGQYTHSSALVSENEEFRDTISEMFTGELPPEAAHILEHHICFATDWDGSIGEYYTFDRSKKCDKIYGIPKPRFLSEERFIMALSKPKTFTISEFLDRWAAPKWLMDDDLHDQSATFMFYASSRDAKPGTGAGESLESEGSSFDELDSIEHWRRELSNFAPAPFELDGRRWATVEHYFQAKKFEFIHPDYFEQFSLDSGSSLAQGSGAEARKAGGKRGKPLSHSERLAWETRKRHTMERALFAKFEQNEHHRKILLATGKAKLTHRPPRSRYVQVEYGLMNVRNQFRSTPSF